MLPFKVSIDKEYKQLMNDVMKFLTLLVVVNIIMFMSNPSENVLFGSVYTKLIISILLGVSTYWLVIDKLVVFD
jgi:hypothetical protein